MWLTNEMKTVYENGLEPGIRNAGFSPMLISNKEHANKIDDEIIAEIPRSAFLVADFTGHRQNVYFETGFAIGLARQVVWTCRKDGSSTCILISGSITASIGRTRRN
jgi:nucleoside 2-deoxyribosyltransferase